MNNFYVYIYWRLDTNEPFYIGKGKDNRWRKLEGRQNEHFINVVNKIPIVVTIEKENLTENEAFYWEEKIIEELVFEYGFSINIKGNNSNNHYCHLVNMCWGGEGHSGWKPNDIWRKKKSESMKGENNPMWGKNPWDYMTEETKKTTSKKISERMSGKNNYWYGKDRSNENNPMYGKHHNDEVKRKISESRIGKYVGENNPMYGKRGKDNQNSKSIICLTTKKIFYSVKEAGWYYGIKSPSDISRCCKGKNKFAGKFNGVKLTWRYLIWKQNKKLRIIVSNK